MRKKDFNDPVFAAKYARKHAKMCRDFAKDIGNKLADQNVSESHILDAGCGSGVTLISLAKRFGGVTGYGIDLSDSLLKIAVDECDKMDCSERIDFVKANVLDIPFEDNYFDVVININMAHLVDDPIKMLLEIKRVLKPGGSLFIADLKRSWLSIFENEIKVAMPAEEAEAIIEISGLEGGTFSSDMLWWKYEKV